MIVTAQGDIGASFTGVTPAGVGTTVTVTVTSPAPLDDGLGNTMAVAPNCLGPGGALGAGTCTFASSEAAAEQVQIGGTVTVGSNQAVGVYTGSIEVIAAF